MAAPAPGAIREERRLVTCLFVDVVGSTDLTMRLGAERWKRELGVAFTEINGIITAHGGTVEKYVGDAIYALFGAPVAHEDDALRALRTAEALRQWCAAGAAHGHPFTVRVGIETGEAVVDLEAAAGTRQQMSVGAVVNIAARLQQRAEPGEVLVGPTAREATEGAAELEPLGDIDLKGLGFIAVWRLVKVGGPPVLQLPFVGREAEIAVLALALQRAQKGRSVLAIVSGPPGQGKTRLVQEFLRERANGAHLIATRCRPADETGVFAPVRQLLGVTTLDALSEQVGRLCTDDVECERVVAGLAESSGIATSASLARLPAAEREDEIVQAWRRYLGILGADRLVVLAVDDIHWADPSLVRLLDRVTFAGPRLLVVATARPEFAQASGVRPTGDRFFIDLEGLDEEEARQLARNAGRADDSVIERAEGNPLFLVELARAHTGDELPLTLQGALGARLDQLGPADRGLLAAAAVAGERFTAPDAAFLAGRTPTEATETLNRLADLHFLDRTEEGYRFHHGLVRDVAYGRLLSAERARAHASYAKARAHPEDVDTLAYHWWQALRPPDAEWIWAADPELPAMRREAFRAHLAAGRRHAEHFAIERATELLDRALAFAGDDHERALAEQALGIANRQLLRMDDSWAHLRRALELFRAAGRVPVAIYPDLVATAQFIGAFLRQPSEDEVTAIADEGAAAARAADDMGALSRILRARAAFVSNRHESRTEEVLPYADAAVEAAEASGDTAALRSALLTRGMLRRRLGHPIGTRALAEMAPLFASADALERMNFTLHRSLDALLEGDLAAAEAFAKEAVTLAEPMGPHNRTHAWGHLQDVHVARGEWAEALDLAQRTARLVREHQQSAFCDSAAGIIRDGAVAHALQGQRDEALALLRAMPTTEIEVDLMAGLPRALLGLASPQTDERLRSARWGWWEWRHATLRAVVLGRPDEAERAVREMGAIVEHSVVQRALGEAVREAVAEMRGGPPATYAALRTIGFDGWAEILSRRVDAGY